MKRYQMSQNLDIHAGHSGTDYVILRLGKLRQKGCGLQTSLGLSGKTELTKFKYP